MNCQETLCFLFRQVEQVGLQLGLLASMAYVASSPHPPPPEMFSIGNALNHKLYVPHAQSISRNILRTMSPKSYSPVGGDASCW